MQPTLRKRIVLVGLAFLIQAVYTPTSLLMQGGVQPKLPIDVFPLWMPWVIPYILCYPLWAAAIAWLVWKTNEGQFRAAVAGLFFTFTLGVSIYLLFPTYIIQPELAGDDLLTDILRFLQTAGGDHDALPSAHIYMTVVLALFYNDWHPRLKWLWLGIVVTVSFSTLFTQQHYIADVLAGYLTGWLGHRLGVWWHTFGPGTKQRRPSHA